MDFELTITEAVAGARLRSGAQTKALRPVTLRLWSEDWHINVPVPGPAELARFVEPRQPVTFLRNGRALLAIGPGEQTPQPVAVLGQAERLRVALADLPDLPTAGETYRDLRQAAQIGGSPLGEYLEHVVREFVRLQEQHREPRKDVVRLPGKTDIARQREARARRRSEEPESIRWAIAAAFSEGDLREGQRVAGPELHRLLEGFLEAAQDEYERMVARPHPEEDREFAEMTMSERREAWEEERMEWDPPAPRRPRLVSSRALYRILRSPAFGWKEGRTGGVVTFIVGAVSAAME